jgi:hypothetical protein
MTEPHDASFSVDLSTREAQLLPSISLAEAGITERADLQRWILDYPEIVGRDLLVITSEFDQWETSTRRVLDRLDVLFLDTQGSLVLAELKRDAAQDAVTLQALKYTAYCDQLTVDDVIDQYSRFHRVDIAAARRVIVEHAADLADGELGPIKARIVANGFGPSVTHVVLFLRELGLDIGCVEVSARRNTDGNAILTARQVLPPPAAEDYLVKRRRKEVVEEKREALSRRRNSVIVLNELGTIPEGAQIRLKLDAFTPEQRAAIEAQIAAQPGYDAAAWVTSGTKVLRWNADGRDYSCSGLTWKMLTDAGFDVGSVPGPDYWLAPSGRTIYQEAIAVEREAEKGTEPE